MRFSSNIEPERQGIGYALNIGVEGLTLAQAHLLSALVARCAEDFPKEQATDEIVNVRLRYATGAYSHKVQAIKILRELTNVGLKEAKEAVESVTDKEQEYTFSTTRRALALNDTNEEGYRLGDLFDWETF